MWIKKLIFYLQPCQQKKGFLKKAGNLLPDVGQNTPIKWEKYQKSDLDTFLAKAHYLLYISQPFIKFAKRLFSSRDLP